VQRVGADFVRPISCDTFTVSRFRPGSRVTGPERRAARRLERRTLVTLQRLRRVSTAEALGYERVDTHHWIDPAYLTDGRVLDPSRPEALVFDVDPALPEPLVLGAMYLAPPGRRGPQPGGPATVWHYHVFASPVCSFSGAIPTGSPDAAGACAAGVRTTRSAEMLHVWVDNPHGAFDSRMTVPAGTVVDRIRRRLAG
jgi:hypothetical protein